MHTQKKKKWLLCTATTTNVNQLAKHAFEGKHSENDGAINVEHLTKPLNTTFALFLCIAKTFYQSKKKKMKRKQTVETVWVFQKRKKKESRRHRQCYLQKVWNAFPQKQYVCGEDSFQGGVPLLVGCGIGKKKKRKIKWVHSVLA